MKNDPIIADSSGLISLASTTDRNHDKAISVSKIIKRQDRKILLPAEIFTETLNILGKKIGHKEAVRIGQNLIESFPIIDTVAEVRNIAFTKFKNQPGSVSLTDCLVMAFADSFDTKDIFGFDEIFRKNNYRRFGIDKK